MNPAAIVFCLISPVGGAEVLGLDLHEKQSDNVKRQLKEASLEHSFLLIRNQDISSVDQCLYGRIFGEFLEVNSSEHEANIVASTGELSLHFDHWLIDNYPQPMHYTMLYGVEAPPVGGETLLVNMKRAYQCLPKSLKSRIMNMQAMHCYDYSYEKTPMRVRETEIPPDQPHAIHPLVLDHPDTGEKVLYISPRNTDRILGVSAEESEALLQELFTYIENQDNVYAHKWKIGDLLIFDNHAMLHGRKDFDPKYKRQLRRLSML